MTTQHIIEIINNFSPISESDLEHDNESFFYDLMDHLSKKLDFEKVIEPIFMMVERYPETDFGTPGPLVHTLESFVAHYETYLFESLKRKPTSLAVHMLNRIINAEENLTVKKQLFARLESLLMNPLGSKEVTETIEELIAFQKSRNSF